MPGKFEYQLNKMLRSKTDTVVTIIATSIWGAITLASLIYYCVNNPETVLGIVTLVFVLAYAAFEQFAAPVATLIAVVWGWKLFTSFLAERDRQREEEMRRVIREELHR
ncbi:hypothetical protein ABID65_006700 [Bradyrhizobium sp. S3.9.2]|uniref:hypothetical protein n=1 Tax=Bradyrhizobium sp. S3.9.2 TaxID=3156432 RepID=UPI00339926BE